MGGFRSLQYQEESTYRSSLGIDGTVGWSVHELTSISYDSLGINTSLHVHFPGTDWEFLRDVYGWAAVQYQAWTRGQISIHATGPQTVLLYIDSVLEFWIDDEPYFGGDFYAYRRAPLVLQLEPGSHKVEIRLIRDLRAMGGNGIPSIETKLMLQVSSGGLAILEEKLLLPEIINNRLASNLAALPLRNETQHWIDVLSIESLDVGTFITRNSLKLY